MSSQEFESFKIYVERSGVQFDNLTNSEKREWSETFDKYKANQQSKPPNTLI